MARQISGKDLSPILKAARKWIDDCLVGDGSVFSADPLWVPALIEEVYNAFVGQPDLGSDAFMVKLERQLANTSPGAKKLAAEMLWALYVFPSNMRAVTKREGITQAWAWSGEALPDSHPMLADEVLAGVGSGGQAYHAHRYRELAFLLNVALAAKKLEPAERVRVFSDYLAFATWIGTVPRDGYRQFRHILRYFAFPERVERMCSSAEYRRVLSAFGTPDAGMRRWSDVKFDEAMLALRRRLETENPGKVLDFYEEPLVSRWRQDENEADEVEEVDAPETPPAESVATDAFKPINRILYGPPGTGKTYRMRQLEERYTERPTAVDRDTWLQETIKPYGWRSIISAILAKHPNGAKVAHLRGEPLVLAKMRHRGRNPSTASPMLWGYLQTHTPTDEENVRYSNRRPPFIFTKSDDSVWRLVDDWREQDPESSELDRLLTAGPVAAKEPIRRYKVITFHPSYTYEEFIRGIRPVQLDDDSGSQFRMVDGAFKTACDEARANSSKRYAFFIDEINRANIAKVFGELITLVEADKRCVFDSEGRLVSGMTVQLPGGEGADGSSATFGVPANLDIYGTMNTADRSIALLDIALRRRFEFEELEPDYSLLDQEIGAVHLGRLLRRINDRLEFLLDREHRIGHAYLMQVKHLDDLRNVFRTRIVPLLAEYFFDSSERMAAVLAVPAGVPAFFRRERRTHSDLFPAGAGEVDQPERIRFRLTDPAEWGEPSFKGIYTDGHASVVAPEPVEAGA